MPQVSYEKKGRIAYMTINRPERWNALNRAAFGQLANAWLDFNPDDETWVAIVTGAEDPAAPDKRAFCFGGNLKEAIQFVDNAEDLASGKQTAGAEGYLPNSPLIAILREVEIYKPIIAAVNGVCLASAILLSRSSKARSGSSTAAP